MANYPTANPSFTTKNNGDTVQASHIDAVQDEIVAIGTDLRGGLQHALTVNGAITTSTGGLTVSTGNTVLGQNLSVAGGSTFGGSVMVSSLVSAPTQPRCVVYSTAALALAAGAFTTISFESEQFDVGGLHSTGSNPTRITVPAGSSGLYLVGTTLRFSTGGAGSWMDARFLKNSTTMVAAGFAAQISSAAPVTLAASVPVVLDGGDWMEVQAFPTGSTGSMYAGTARNSASDFWAMKVW